MSNRLSPLQHRDSLDSSAEAPFEFSEDNYEKVKSILAKYPPQYKQSAIIPLLHLAQNQNDGWLSLNAMDRVAKITEVAPIRVYEVATFYTMFNRKPIGKHHLQVCTTTPCELRGARETVQAIEKELGIHVGGMTADGKFSLIEVECLGACVNGPCMELGAQYYEDLTPENVVSLIQRLKNGQPVKPGPQPGPLAGKRRAGDGPLGQTSLKSEPTGPVCRNLGEVKAAYLKEKEAEAAAKAAATKK